MRIDRSVITMTILATLAACSAPAEQASVPAEAAPPVAAAPAPDPAPPPTVVESPRRERERERPPVIQLNVRWDSGPLDRDYHRERSDLDARQARERSAPRADETSRERGDRQSRESKALELRYSRGRASHARGMPPQ